MPDQQDSIGILLLDYRLQQLGDAARRELEQRLADDPELRARLERLDSVLQPLETWVAPPPPTNLVSDILDRIEQNRYPRLIADPGASLPEARGGPFRPRITLRELVAVAACVMFFVGVFVPSVSHARFQSRQTMCRSNLASIFGGMASYATANGGLMPNVGMAPGGNWLQESPNRRNFHILLRFRYVPQPSTFVCPSRSDHRPIDDNPVACDTFPGNRHCSYDLQNLAGPPPTMTHPGCLPVVSDANPLFEGGRFNEGLDPNTTNSRSHKGRGQNVLCQDGRVEWAFSPMVGKYADNIWTTGNVRRYRGTEVQQTATDSFLIP